jgi:hypothetical protein
LLGVVRLTQSVSVGSRRHVAADAFAVAAAGDNPVYSSAAAYRYATLLDADNQEHLRASWQRVVDTGSRVYSPVAHYAIAQSWRQEGRDDEAEKSMVKAYTSGDTEYGPKAAVWLIEYAARAGKWDRVSRINDMVNMADGPFFVHSDYEQHRQSASVWRYQLLDTLNPVTMLRATHAIAQFDGVTETPNLQTLLREHLETLADSAESLAPAKTLEDSEIPASEAELWQRPWWLTTVAAHQERGTLPELTHDLFWLIDRFYTRIAVPYAENDIEDPINLLHDLMHAADDFRWGWLLQESVRQRINAIVGFEVLSPYWPSHDQSDEEKTSSR